MQSLPETCLAAPMLIVPKSVRAYKHTADPEIALGSLVGDLFVSATCKQQSFTRYALKKRWNSWKQLLEKPVILLKAKLCLAMGIGVKQY